MHKVTFDAEPMVRICIEGEEVDFIGFREDDGKIHKFQRFLREKGLVGHGISCRSGVYVGYFFPSDTQVIKEWFTANNVVPKGP